MSTSAGAYLRLSNDDGRQGESLSIEGQRADCQRYADRMGWAMVEFVEDGVSASKGLDRPKWNALVDAMANADIQVVLVSKQDRITRDEREWFEFSAMAVLAGVEVHTVEAGNLNLHSEIGMLNAGMRSLFAAFEARLIAARTRRGQETSRAKGNWPYSATFGYGPKGVVKPDQAEWIRWAYDAVLNDGVSSKEIFDEFRANKVLTARGNEFYSVTSVLYALRNPAIAGLLTYKGEVIGKGNWEPIVSEAERDRFCAAIAARRTSDKGHGERKARKYVLAGLVLCGTPGCDLKVMRAQNPGNGRNHYFCCDKRRGGCGARVRGKLLDGIAFLVANQFIQSQQGEPTPERAPFDGSAITETEEQVAEVRSALVAGDMRTSDAIPVLRDLNQRLDALRAAQAAYEAESVEAASWHRTVRESMLTEDGATAMGVRQVLDNVVVLPEGLGFRWESKAGQVHETPLVLDGEGVQVV
ncbi:recombinase family protein [Kribbella alba]|uniref:recombinase family protein n=1 Tax=Kribbella alba TaxID=190197 RepID=UPI0031E2F853